MTTADLPSPAVPPQQVRSLRAQYIIPVFLDNVRRVRFDGGSEASAIFFDLSCWCAPAARRDLCTCTHTTSLRAPLTDYVILAPKVDVRLDCNIYTRVRYTQFRRVQEEGNTNIVLILAPGEAENVRRRCCRPLIYIYRPVAFYSRPSFLYHTCARVCTRPRRIPSCMLFIVIIDYKNTRHFSRGRTRTRVLTIAGFRRDGRSFGFEKRRGRRTATVVCFPNALKLNA